MGKARVPVSVIIAVVLAAGAGYAVGRAGARTTRTIVRVVPTPSALPASPSPPPQQLIVRVRADGVRQCALGFALPQYWTLRETGTSIESWGRVLAVAQSAILSPNTKFCGLVVTFAIHFDDPAFMVVESSGTAANAVAWGPLDTDQTLSRGVVRLNFTAP